MSDCSTAAMKPKAIDLHECVDCEHYCAECDSCCKGVPDHQDCMFRCWKPSRAYKLEQRFQQLEQVAKKMYGFMNLIFDDLGIEPTFTSAVTHEVMSLPRFREQLEALEVKLRITET